MAIYWKLIIDVLFVIAVVGDLGFLTLVKQKDEFMYLNISLLSTLCSLYLLYFSQVRKSEIKSWLEEKKLSQTCCLTVIRRKMRSLFSSKFSYWFVIVFKITVILIIVTYTIVILVLAWNRQNFALHVISTVLACIVIFHSAVVMPFVSGSNLKLLGGILLIMIGIFFIYLMYGILELQMAMSY